MAQGANFNAQSTITLTPSNGTVEQTTIYVRMKAGLTIGEYEDDILIASTGADEVEVTCIGSVLELPEPGGDYVHITDLSALSDGIKVILAARYNQNANAYLAIGNTLDSGKLNTTECTINGEALPSSIVDNEDSYYWTVAITDGGYTFTNANGQMIGYGASGTNFVMGGEKTEWTINSGVSPETSLVPNYQGFNIVNTTNDSRAFALRVTENDRVVKAYATSNMNNGEYNFFLDIFMSGEAPQPTPQLAVTPTSLSNFNYAYGEGPSATQTCTVSGTLLTENVTITAPEHFEISLSATGTFGNSLMLEPTSGTLEATSVYVRLAAGLSSGSYSGNLAFTSGELGATVTLSGNVGNMPVAATPVFSIAEGTYLTTQNVEISSATEGAVIHYTMDGTDPTENSPIYSQPIVISVTTTLKAIATATGYANSAIATATYTISEPMNISDIRNLANDTYACMEGTVIFIDGRNVYVQDETAGIDLYLNNNTVPVELALGDLVRAYGKKTVYNGLVELTGINGSNPEEFVIVSSGNPLPLAVKTIAEINTDFNGNNMLQSTRVKIEDAIIGPINTNGITVITQEDRSSLNVYHIPYVEGLMEGDIVTIIGVISCYNQPQLRVNSADDIEFEHGPVLTASPTTLSGLTYDVVTGGPSQIVYFELSGDNLIDNAYIYPSEHFEVSTFENELFTPENPAVVMSSTNSFYDIKIYVRMKAGLEVGTYTDQLTISSEGAQTIYVTVTGTVTGDGPTPPPVSGDYVRISSLSELTAGSYVVFAARFDENATSYYAMHNASSGKPEGELFTSTTAGSNEILPSAITDEEIDFYWTVGVTSNGYTFTNANGEMIGYSSSTNFSTGGDNIEWSIESGTAGDEAMVPGYTGFVITNVNNDARHFALNSNHNFGPYHTNNINNSGYNFYLDLFVKGEGGTPVVATPTFTPAAGTYTEAQTVSIACATEGATIYYTLDGSDPTESSPVYSTPLTIATTTTVKAFAVKDEYEPSAIATAVYVIQSGYVTIFNQDWEGEMNGWTFVDVQGEATWTVAQYSGNHYAYANGYNHGANIDWCISPAFNLDDLDNPVLTFRTAKNYTGPDLEVYFSNNYNGTDPTTATWQSITCALSQGSWNWVESGDINLSGFNGTSCYIGFKYTSEENQAAGWEVDDIMLVAQTSTPVITASPLSLTGFSYVVGNGPSAEQSFTVSAFNLTANLTLAETTDFEISTTTGSAFNAQSTITLTPTNGTVAETTIYVRMKAGLSVGDYEGDIEIVSTGATTVEVTCGGSVVEEPVPGDDYIRISDVSDLQDGNKVILAARYNETVNVYLAMVNTLTSGKLTTTEFTSQMSGANEIIPGEILADEDDYYWTVNVTADGYTFTNANGDMIGYGNSGTNFVMGGEKTEWTISTDVSGENALVPNYFGFNIINVATSTRAFALRVTESESVVKAYATSNMNNGEYNFFLDIFMQGEGGTPTVAAPTFDPAGGTYYETQDVTLSCATPDATILYSLDSSTGPWYEYDDPITVDESLTIWAYATKEGYNNSPVVSAEYIIQNDIVIIFNQDWEEDWHGWSEVSVEGEAVWDIASYQGNHYAYINGYSGGAAHANIDWLLSPAFDLNSYSDVVLTFKTAMNYTGPALEVFFSNDYDGQNPGAATWQPLSCALSQGSWNWVESGEISLDGFNGSNCYIGFKYTSTDEEAAAWEVDDIMLVSGGSSNATLTATPNSINGLDYVEGYGPSASQSYTLTAANLEGTGSVMVTVSEGFEISLDDDDFGNELELAYANGQLVGQPITVYVRLAEGLSLGSYQGTITHQGGGASATVSLAGSVHSEDEPLIEAYMPLYIQGNNGSNNNRVPVATAVIFMNLEPSTTYRYTNQFVDGNDGPETAGAGNVIYASQGGFYRSTSPSLSTEGGYGEFTTDEDGIGFAWCINEPTANARFTPGNQVYLRVRVNDGHDGTTVSHIFTTEDYATVLNFGTESEAYQGTAFYAKSNEAPMTFAMLFSSDIDERPVYSTPIETTGIDYVNISQYANFYKEEVAGKDGWFGGILPNDNENGINEIWILDLESYIVNYYHTENGQWYPDANTVNPNAGLNDPLFIDLTYDDVNETVETHLNVWTAFNEFIIENGDDDHYTLTVYNILGQPMMKEQINANSTVHLGHHLSKGLYIFNFLNNKSQVSIKVIVR